MRQREPRGGTRDVDSRHVAAPRMLHREDPGWRRRHVFGVLGLRPAVAQHSHAEAELLMRYAAGAHTVVELGVAEGGSAAELRSVMSPSGRLYLIDPYVPGRLGVSMAGIVARRTVNGVRRGSVDWLSARSDEAVIGWDRQIDFLFIDADHSYARAAGDWQSWTPFVRPGGYVAMHDSVVFPGGWTDERSGPVRLLREICASGRPWVLVEQADSLTVFRREQTDRVVAGGVSAAAGSPEPHQPTVTVCIPTRNRPTELARALGSLSRSTFAVAQVVVSDDGHDAATEAVCRDAPVEVDYVNGPQRGIGANRNRAIDAATSDIVAFIDDDGALLPDFLDKATACMRSGAQRHGMGRVIVSGRSLTERGELVGAHDQTFLGHQAKSYTSGEGLRSFSANAVIFPACVFRDIRFDPQLVYGYDEVDFASRAAAAGYVIVDCPEAVNYHESPPHARDLQDRHVEASRLHVTLRRYAVTERALLRALAFALIAPIHMLAADIKRAGLSGVRRSVTTLGLAAGMLWRARS